MHNMTWCVAFFTLAVVGDIEEPSGVAGRCDPDLLLPLCGLWRSHSFLQL